MADSSTESIVVGASPAAVMAVIADFPAYPRWASAMKQVEVLTTGPTGRAATVRFVLDAGLIKDDYILAYDWDDDRRVDWHLVRSRVQTDQRGSYTLRDLGGRTEVTYSLSVDVNLPVLGVVKRKAEQAVMDTALRELKRRVEASAAPPQ